jgi:AcrR family transcriptional regulator
MTNEPEGLRGRKKQATRHRIVEAAYGLFERDGFEETTVEAVARAAEVSPATFYNYFPVKEDLLFPDRDRILQAGLDAAGTGAPGEAPADAVARVVRAMIASTIGGLRDPSTELETRRIRLVSAVPQLQARMMQNAFAVVERLAAALRAARPDDGGDDYVAMLGAVFGAAFAAGTASVRRGRTSAEALEQAVDYVTDAFRRPR